jgi:hypothetical protein
MSTIPLAKVVGKAIFLSSIISSLGSVEMSSRFSVLNFSKDQVTLQRAADALRSFLMVSSLWTVGTMLSLFAEYGWCGALIGLLACLIMMAWIIISYIKAFKEAAKENHLQVPEVIRKADWWWISLMVLIVIVIMVFATLKQ